MLLSGIRKMVVFSSTRFEIGYRADTFRPWSGSELLPLNISGNRHFPSLRSAKRSQAWFTLNETKGNPLRSRIYLK
jgi:hypothetical protein